MEPVLLLISPLSFSFPVADGRGHPRPSGLLHEETQVVCVEEQEDRLQASQINGNKHTPTWA